MACNCTEYAPQILKDLYGRKVKQDCLGIYYGLKYRVHYDR